MDLDAIKKINRDALRAAKESQNGEDYTDKQHMYMYLAAAVAAALAFYGAQRYEFSYAMVEKNGRKEFDRTRGLIIAAIVALLVFLLCRMYCK